MFISASRASRALFFSLLDFALLELEHTHTCYGHTNCAGR